MPSQASAGYQRTEDLAEHHRHLVCLPIIGWVQLASGVLDRGALSSSGYPMSCKCDPASAKWASPSGAATPSPDSTMLALCRDWLIATGGHGVRQEGYQTAAGEMVEFFADADAADAPELSEETHAYLFGAL